MKKNEKDLLGENKVLRSRSWKNIQDILFQQSQYKIVTNLLQTLSKIYVEDQQ